MGKGKGKKGGKKPEGGDADQPQKQQQQKQQESKPSRDEAGPSKQQQQQKTQQQQPQQQKQQQQQQPQQQKQQQQQQQPQQQQKQQQQQQPQQQQKQQDKPPRDRKKRQEHGGGEQRSGYQPDSQERPAQPASGQQAWRQQQPSQQSGSQESLPPPFTKQPVWRQQAPAAQPDTQQARGAQPPPQQAWRGQPPPQQSAWRPQTPAPVAQPDTQQARGAQPPPQQAWRGQPPPQQSGGRGAPFGAGAQRSGQGRGTGYPPPGSATTSPAGAPPGFQQPTQPPVQPVPVQQPTDTTQTSGRKQQYMPAQAGPEAEKKPSLPPPSAGGDIGSLTSKMTKLTLLPLRKEKNRPPKEGRGRKIQVETNHLALSIKDPKAIVYHYDVDIKPERPFKFYRLAVRQVQEKFYPNQFPAFDGKKNLYSYKKLPIPKDILHCKVEVYDEERERMKEIEVNIKLANTVNLATIGEYCKNGSSLASPQEALQALDIVLRNPASQKFCQVGRSFFTPPSDGQLIQLGGGLDLWYGFYQSAILGWAPFLNVDVAHKGFPAAENCLDVLCDFLKVRRGQLDRNSEPRYLNEFTSFIKNLRVCYEISKGAVRMKRTSRVNGLAKCPRFNTFRLDNKQEITVEQYFRQEYNYQTPYPLVPCIECGTKEKPISYPMELCRIVEGQNVNRKLNDVQTRNMVRAAAVAADKRKRKIDGSVREVGFNQDPCVREFGITVASQFTNVDARILYPPDLLYKQGLQKVIKGVWQSGTFLSTNPLNRWAVVNGAEPRLKMQSIQNLTSSLQQTGKKLGLDMANPIVVSCNNARDLEARFSEWKAKGIELAIVVLPEFRGITYANVKQIAEQQVGILTQCLKMKTLEKLSPATVTNILLKINSKHNGINHNIKCNIWEKYFSVPTIVFGADVTHPAPGQETVPSVAAVAASYEPKAFSYNMEWRLQPPRQEMIVDLENIVKKQLLAFYNKNRGQKPQRIFFYRDGVSEGQFKKVMDIELQAIRRACAALGAEYQPPITFLVVQKRHHTRFFPQREDADGRNFNVPAGTVVDTKITHPNEVDFYLVSHASIQGTSRPTKYHVLWDDSYMSEDDLEELTYYLCHLFTRCTRAVSYPAPTYYAHLAAFRIRSYCENQQININNLAREESMRRINEDFVKKSPMFFI